ncbi:MULTISPECIES: NAD(P)-dependent alcohol dehydrogenase [Acinetobacter calcoaceticus/baumannii complex]|uniref:NAD(P)-dependent alcohol dehydrogenase n=1 Tax=Acinetobacter calcoaceticus/baumannii complex TaxID=909768 RepID=UPI000927423A|nr:NAD(P)-dependent alcohol dehydrogenase [Acinetobacter baumannii]AZB91304.1 NAD(P)-dependent alcohol dehydrogenase [Acinetobacter pittii]OJK07412.1 alcohol dehydrogenase [Acinetobacter baumannii]HCW3746949.1 NAD(P)-dependent alcohol dehydrogenase [Acinetobacter baumannii]
MTNFTEITAAVTQSKGADFELRQLQIREPQDDEVLVKIVATGMCHTDLIVRDQYYPVPLPAVLGHEGSGIVEAIGPNVKDLAIGDHVVLSYGYCGTCEQCGSGNPAYCQDFFGRNFGGTDPEGNSAICTHDHHKVHDHFFGQSSFATYAISRENNAVKVTQDVPLELLGPLGCGIQTGAGAVINALGVRPASSFVTWGAGAVGLSALLAAKVCGATTIIAVDIVESRLTLAKELGATHVINSKVQDPIEAIKEITQGGVQFALESTGRPEIVKQGIDALGILGKIAIVGAPPLGVTAAFDVNDLLIGGKSITGVVEGNSVAKRFIPELVALYQQGKFPFDKLIRFYDFKDINQAAIDSQQGITLKPILKIG